MAEGSIYAERLDPAWGEKMLERAREVPMLKALGIVRLAGK